MAERYDRFCHLAVDEALRKSGAPSADRTEHLYDEVASVFEKAGGSWVALAEADTQAWVLLKRCCRACLHGLRRKIRHKEALCGS